MKSIYIFDVNDFPVSVCISIHKKEIDRFIIYIVHVYCMENSLNYDCKIVVLKKLFHKNKTNYKAKILKFCHQLCSEYVLC